VTPEPCDGCGDRVRVAGGIGDMWNAPTPSGGMTIEFADGDEAFLCFSCIDALPDDPTTADVDALPPDDRER